MASLQETLEGFIRVISSIIPNNLNPKLWVVRNEDVQGSDQNFATLQELVDFHPFKMKRGMIGTVQNYPSVGKSTDFKLMYDPALMVTGEASVVTLANYSVFWKELRTDTPPSIRVYEYSPDGPGGGSPVYPYTLAEEDNWEPEFDRQKNHRWMRFRDDDTDENTDGIFDNWSIPLPLSSFSSGDYVENRFQRYTLSKPGQDLTLIGDLENGRHYVVINGTVTLNGVEVNVAARFTYVTGDTVVFSVGAIVNETNIAPPRTDANGLPNNEPVGWADTPPVGTGTLWMITGQKSVYGQLKSDWIIRKIEEASNYVRYSYSASPDPNTICSTTDSAADGTQIDTDLINAGWIKTFSDQIFMAYRDDTGTPGVYTAWEIEKIADESGEYVDNVFKLYPINTDPDSPSVQAPLTRTPWNEGWSDIPLVETATTINFISTARKFFDGTLKGPWSPPIPYTGKSTYQDVIVTSPGDEFRIDPNATPVTTVPSLITLEHQLFKGADKVWEQQGVTITYVWTRVYDNGAIDATEAGPNSGSDFYYLAGSGVAGTSGYLFDNQRIAVKPAAVTGKAVFRCVATLQTTGDPIIFEEEISLIDISDGKDAKNLTVTADNRLVIYDTSNTVFVPANIVLRGYYSNLGSPTLYWYHWNGASWDALTTGSTYSATAATYFTADGSAEEARFAVSNHSTDPTAADGITYFTDYTTIGKTSSAGVGSPGESSVIALLENESHTAVVDVSTGQPFAGEIGVSGKASTKVEMWDGTTKLSLGISATDGIMGISSDNPNIAFVQVFGTQGSDAEKYGRVYVSTWAANEISAVCTITITYASKVYTKKFSISSTKDADGAIILDIDSNKGFVFTADDRTDKTFEAKLYDSNILQTSGYEYGWYIGGVLQGSFTTSRTKVLSRTAFSSSTYLRCDVRPISGAVIRSRTVKITDILDTQATIAWTDYATTTNANKIVNGTLPSALPIAVAGATWRLSTDSYWATNTPAYACIGEETSSGWIWTSPYRIQGEKGDQGLNSDYFFYMFKASGTTITSGWNVITAYNNGWRRTPPVSGIVYMTMGRFNGTTAALEVDGYPPDAAVPEGGWTAPVKISGTDGLPGDDGTPGSNGWSPVFSVIADGSTRDVLRLIDWTGGSGTKPGFIGQYVSSSGFTTVIGNAVNIKGGTGPAGTSGKIFSVSVPTGNGNWTLTPQVDHSIYYIHTLVTGTINIPSPLTFLDSSGQPMKVQITVDAGRGNDGSEGFDSGINTRVSIITNVTTFDRGLLLDDPPVIRLGDRNSAGIGYLGRKSVTLMTNEGGGWNVVSEAFTSNLLRSLFDRTIYYPVNSIPPEFPSWSNGLTLDTLETISRGFLATVCVNAYGNSNVIFNVEVQQSTDGVNFSTLKGWSYKPDISGSSSYTVPFTMIHRSSGTYRYFRVRVSRANSDAGTIQYILLNVRTIINI